MDSVFLKARAKINIALDIISKRDDGYHNMKMVMQTLNIFDGIFIKKIRNPQIIINTTSKWLPVDERNLCYKGAHVLLKEFDIKTGLSIDIDKTIPVSAGLAGGSSDCAATLIGVKRLFNLPISHKQLCTIGASLGSDVPYCIMRGSALAEGIGDILTPLPPHPPTYVVLAKPPLRVSTAGVFKKFDINNVKNHPDIEKIIIGLNEKDIYKISRQFSNVLETVTEYQHPIITDIKNLLVQYGAIGTLMSGSGPTVFGYFEDKNEATFAIRKIKLNIPNIHEIYLTTIYNPNRKGMNIL